MGRTLGGLALVTAGALIPFNWGSQCPAGQDRSYLGYDCYADAAKEVTAAYSGSGARLGAGLGMIARRRVTPAGAQDLSSAYE